MRIISPCSHNHGQIRSHSAFFLARAEATRRGLGAVLLRKPRSLAKLVHGIASESELPLTVKVRLGESESKINVQRVVKLLTAAGAAAVIVHGRTMEQRCESTKRLCD